MPSGSIIHLVRAKVIVHYKISIKIDIIYGGAYTQSMKKGTLLSWQESGDITDEIEKVEENKKDSYEELVE